MTETKARALNRALLAWYDRHRRVLPWRAAPGEVPDPYRVWLSEIMLQQTTVAVVGPYYARFLQRFPTVEALAAAPLDDVLTLWSGLGYYRRARHLKACAQLVVDTHGGRFPNDPAVLRALPGIGPYTAAAVAAIAFGHPALPVDGNVERVMARFYGVETPLPKAKPDLAQRAQAHVQRRRAGDLAQALMDLGATVCTPKSPRCELCPWQASCVARARGLEELLPRREAKKTKPLRCALAFFVERRDGALLLRKRTERGLLGGLWEVPSTPWQVQFPRRAVALGHAPLEAHWIKVAGKVRHSFTHFDLALEVWQARVEKDAAAEGRFLPRTAWDAYALPSLTRKVIAHVLDQERSATALR